MNIVEKYDLGYPFQFSIMGFGFTFLLAPIVISFFYLTGGIISAIPLMPMGYYLVFIRKHLYISKESYKIENRLPLFTWGKWVHFKNFKAITIKYTILNANKGAKRGNNPKDPMKKIDLKQPNQDLKDTDETWLVHLINSNNEKILLINTSKKTALEIITLIMEHSSLKPYLSNYRNGFELDERLLRSGQLKIST
ncbi:MAG: hypothetical protein H6600_03580 [Flavobacteriales bacterium]|nr:hypothetical protein [Flavobacteriales bacterium]